MNPATIERVLDLAVQIQQIPAPTFEEENRAKWVCKMFAWMIVVMFTHESGDKGRNQGL
jgi:hypothetical protein